MRQRLFFLYHTKDIRSWWFFTVENFSYYLSFGFIWHWIYMFVICNMLSYVCMYMCVCMLAESDLFRNKIFSQQLEYKALWFVNSFREPIFYLLYCFLVHALREDGDDCVYVCMIQFFTVRNVWMVLISYVNANHERAREWEYCFFFAPTSNID